MSKETYIKGFCKAAAAHKINPEALAKYAGESSLVSDVVLGGLGSSAFSSLFPAVGPLVASGSHLAGCFSDLEPDKSSKEQWRAALPWVGSYRMGNRVRKQVLKELKDIENSKKDKDARPIRHAVAEHLGLGTSTLASILAGTGLGLGVGGRKGALAGAITGAAGSVAANVAAAIAAAVNRRRTAKEQIESDKRSVLGKYLIPGLSTYDAWKRLGRSEGDRDEAKGAMKSDSK